MDTGEFHRDGTDKNGDPRKSVFEHMEVDSFLIERFALSGGESGEEIKEHTEDGKKHHTFVIDFGGILYALNSLDDKVDGTHNKESGDHKAANYRVFFALFSFKKVGDAGGDGVGKTVERIGGDGGGIGNEAAGKFDARKN